MTEIDPPDIGYAKAQRLIALARLAGVYMIPATQYPMVERVIQRQPDLMRYVTPNHEQGTSLRRERGIAEAEWQCAVVPYRLWVEAK